MRRKVRRVVFKPVRRPSEARIVPKQNEHQSTIPRDPHLSKKLGIAPRSRVLFFASYYGDWAKAISDFARVTSLDVSASALAFSSTNNRGKIRTFLRMDAGKYPRKEGTFDWSVSYEPYPLKKPHNHANLRQALIRALLNRKGAKIVIGTAVVSYVSQEALVRAVRKVAKEFGAKETTTIVPILVQRIAGHPVEKVKCIISTLETNPRARTQAADYLKGKRGQN